MDIISKMATDFATNVLYNPHNYKESIESARYKLYDIDSISDKIKFLTIVLERNNIKYQEHLLKCTDKENCQKNFGYENVNYYLTQELNRLGVRTDENMFTEDEKENYETKLDKILSELELIKETQKFSYVEVMEELEELKNLFFLGKKNWQQLFLGKIADMTFSGIIGETVSKDIIQSFHKDFPHLIQ